LRFIYYLLDLSLPEGQQECAAKLSKNPADSRESYFQDVLMHAKAKTFADEYNVMNPPKKVDFVLPVVMEFKLRKAPASKGHLYMNVEPFLKGHYKKYSNNFGFVSGDDRNTPHAFSHFTHHASGGKLLVCDIQGVEDMYTDPQIHSVDRSHKWGKGDMGQQGIVQFFNTHRCSSICEFLKLSKHSAKGSRVRPNLIASSNCAPLRSMQMCAATPSAKQPAAAAAAAVTGSSRPSMQRRQQTGADMKSSGGVIIKCSSHNISTPSSTPSSLGKSQSMPNLAGTTPTSAQRTSTPLEINAEQVPIPAAAAAAPPPPSTAAAVVTPVSMPVGRSLSRQQATRNASIRSSSAPFTEAGMRPPSCSTGINVMMNNNTPNNTSNQYPIAAAAARPINNNTPTSNGYAAADVYPFNLPHNDNTPTSNNHHAAAAAHNHNNTGIPIHTTTPTSNNNNSNTTNNNNHHATADVYPFNMPRSDITTATTTTAASNYHHAAAAACAVAPPPQPNHNNGHYGITTNNSNSIQHCPSLHSVSVPNPGGNNHPVSSSTNVPLQSSSLLRPVSNSHQNNIHSFTNNVPPTRCSSQHTSHPVC
jgi:hypothetical protein